MIRISRILLACLLVVSLETPTALAFNARVCSSSFFSEPVFTSEAIVPVLVSGHFALTHFLKIRMLFSKIAMMPQPMHRGLKAIALIGIAVWFPTPEALLACTLIIGMSMFTPSKNIDHVLVPYEGMWLNRRELDRDQIRALWIALKIVQHYGGLEHLSGNNDPMHLFLVSPAIYKYNLSLHVSAKRYIRTTILSETDGEEIANLQKIFMGEFIKHIPLIRAQPYPLLLPPSPPRQLTERELFMLELSELREPEASAIISDHDFKKVLWWFNTLHGGLNHSLHFWADAGSISLDKLSAAIERKQNQLTQRELRLLLFGWRDQLILAWNDIASLPHIESFIDPVLIPRELLEGLAEETVAHAEQRLYAKAFTEDRRALFGVKWLNSTGHVPIQYIEEFFRAPHVFNADHHFWPHRVVLEVDGFMVGKTHQFLKWELARVYLILVPVYIAAHLGVELPGLSEKLRAAA